MNDIMPNDVVTAERKLLEILTASETTTFDEISGFRTWFLEQFKTEKELSENGCTLEKFAIYFLSAVHQQTYTQLRSFDSNDIGIKAEHETALEKTNIQQNVQTTTERNKSETSFPALGTPTGGRCFTPNLPRNASTPVRRGLTQQLGSQRKSLDTGGRSFNSTMTNSSFEKSRNLTGDGVCGGSSLGSTSFCLGDFISSPNISNRHTGSQKKKHQPSSSSSTPNSCGKPKKRVVPISISKSVSATLNESSPFGAHSSFSHENNILLHSPTEISEFNKCAVAEARKALKKDLTEVTSALKAIASPPKAKNTPTKVRTSISDVTQGIHQISITTTDGKLCANNASIQEFQHFNEIPTNISSTIKFLARVYAILIDMNFVINILNEISFLLNLLNAYSSIPNHSNAERGDIGNNVAVDPNNILRLLGQANNSSYFAVCVLEFEQHTLTLMDAKSLGVVLQCERLVCLAPNLKAKLRIAQEQKLSIAVSSEYQNASVGKFKNVCFQEDTDSRKFFPSAAEFGAFKTQRDIFYISLKLWEKHHLNPAWNFATEVAPKVREIFRLSENSVNMSHFAKLFVSQLLISASDKTSPEDIGIQNDDVDLQKFNKLSQRLVAPSNFSVDYQFPREQAYFRDFIIESRSLAFIEHLKMVLFLDLIALNDSTFEHLNLMGEEVGYREMQDVGEFVVRPSVLCSMLILAKFLGFVTALPFHGTGNSSDANGAHIQNYQLRLRQLFHSPIDVSRLLDDAVSSGRHLITLPWLVQFMAMLDEVTLQLETFANAIQEIFELYAALGNGNRQLSPTATFIVRCCLGWLFEQKPFLAAEYYNYRRTKLLSNALDVKSCIQLNLELGSSNNTTTNSSINALLESVVTVACPFLAEFRVSIMPAKFALTKYVSRSGRYRHITPCIADTPKANEIEESTQKKQISESITKQHFVESATSHQRKLMESFLHAQNSSMLRLIVFLTERSYKCVIKDAQHKILLPSKIAADSRVNEINSVHQNEVYNMVKTIYRNARKEAIEQWDNEVPNMLSKRITQGLDALTPTDTASIIKEAYAWRIQTDADIKIQQWRYMNLFKNDFYCNDLHEITEKICKANTNRPKQATTTTQSTELKLIKSKPSISDLIEEMQHWLYTSGSSSSLFVPQECPTNTRTQKLSIDNALIDYLARLTDSFENTLPTIYYRLIGAGLIQIVQHLIALNPGALTTQLIRKICEFYKNKKMQKADEGGTNKHKTAAVDRISQNPISERHDNVSANNDFVVTTIFQTLISAPFIKTLNVRTQCFDKLKEFLIAMIENEIVKIDFLNELFVSVFKHDLQTEVFNEVSKLLNELSMEVKLTQISTDYNNDNDDGDNYEDNRKSQLFMQALADFSRDLDDF